LEDDVSGLPLKVEVFDWLLILRILALLQQQRKPEESFSHACESLKQEWLVKPLFANISQLLFYYLFVVVVLIIWRRICASHFFSHLIDLLQSIAVLVYDSADCLIEVLFSEDCTGIICYWMGYRVLDEIAEHGVLVHALCVTEEVAVELCVVRSFNSRLEQ